MSTRPGARRFVLALAALVALPALARADTLDEAVRELAKEIAAECKEQRELKVALGVTRMPARYGATSGPGIEQRLVDELKTFGVTKVTHGAELTVLGSAYFDKSAPSIEVRFHVEDDSGTVLRRIKKTVTNTEDVARLMGVTSYTAPEKPWDERKALADAVTDPKSVIKQGTRIASADGKYGFEVLVDGKPREVKKGDGGLAFVGLAVGDVYTIKLYNDSDHNAAATVYHDGLSSHHFAEPNVRAHGRIVGAKGGTSEVKGWCVDKEKGLQFVTRRAGTITVCFHGAYDADEKWPKDEGLAASQLTVPVEDRGVIVKKHVGRLRGAASLRIP